MRRLAFLEVALALGAVAAAPAAAQPQPQSQPRYPKPPLDEDREREQHSTLWEAASHPAKAPYAAAMDEGRRKAAEGDYAGAIELADRAIALLPDAPDAYQLRGQARLRQHADWAGCAGDLAAALARGPVEKLDKNIRHDLGVCQARAGRLADAEATLADAAAVLGPNDRERAEVWMRLGEVRVAMGKLDEAIAAFDAAAPDGATPSAQVLWMRAGAYDRAREPSKAEDDVRAAMLSGDRNLSQIDNGMLPLLGAGEREFLFGIGWKYAEAQSVEQALYYFRRFVAVAPQSPWRRRAEEHLRELGAIALPAIVARTSGNAPLDGDAATKIVRDGMPKLRACLVKAPSALLEVRITRTGPHAPVPPPDVVRGPYLRYHAPPAGVQITPLLQGDDKVADVEDGVRCVEAAADKLPLPVVKDKEAYYQISFEVIAP